MVVAGAALSLVVAACSGSSSGPFASGAIATASPQTTTVAPSAASAAAAASGAPSAAPNDLYVRSWSVGASDPVGFYFSVPQVISDGQVRYVPEVQYTSDLPSPLFTAPLGRSISPAGQAAIVARAQADGLLGATSTFDCVPPAGTDPTVGGAVPHFQIKTGGASHDISGSCLFDVPSAAPASPAPGTWAAFNDFATNMANLSGWLGPELGPETPFEPASVIVWEAPAAGAWWGPIQVDPNAAARPWPLKTPLASFGNPVHWSGVAAPDPSRCTVLTGPDVHTLLTAVTGALDNTQFTDGTTTRVLAIVVVMPGEPTDGLCGQ